MKKLLKNPKKLLLPSLALVLGLIMMLVFSGKNSEAIAEQSAERQIEERLEELCSSIDGVGKCRVMVSCSYEYQGYGRDPTLHIVSVAIVCKGGNRTEVRHALTELITSLYGIGSNRVSISRGSP